MSIFLCLSDRYQRALKTFDPMHDEWLFRIIDPLPKGSRNGSPCWFRIFLAGLVLLCPHWIFSAIPSNTFGGRLLGWGGLATDIGYYSIIFFMSVCLVLIPIMRRVLGDLLNELVLRGVAEPDICRFTPGAASKGKILIFLERVTRVNGYRGFIWYLLMVVDQIFIYYVYLSDGKSTWHSSNIDPNSLFYFFHVGNEQPNLAGIWAFLVFGPIGLYFCVLMARMIIVFACQCSEMARMKTFSITPSHPDGTGGLLPIGEVALLFAFFTSILGLDMFFITLNEMMVNSKFQPDAAHGNTNLHVLSMLWILYLFLGTLLFFLPLLPLRARMAAAKRRYLLLINDLQTIADRNHQANLLNKNFDPNSLQGLETLNTLFNSGTAMAVWPFDKKTFLSYAGVLMSPFLALFATQMLPRIMAWLKMLLDV